MQHIFNGNAELCCLCSNTVNRGLGVHGCVALHLQDRSLRPFMYLKLMFAFLLLNVWQLSVLMYNITHIVALSYLP